MFRATSSKELEIRRTNRTLCNVVVDFLQVPVYRIIVDDTVSPRGEDCDAEMTLHLRRRDLAGA